MNLKTDIPSRTTTSDILFTLSDLGNAERFHAYYGDWCRYVPELNVWRVFDSTHWIDDENLVRMKYMSSMTVRKIYGEIEEIDDIQMRRDLAHHALKSESSERIKAIISILPTQNSINLNLHNWDTSKYLLNVNNGTINLITGELQKHNRYDYITTLIPYDYSPDTECPLWHQFLNRATGNNEDLKTYLQRAAGYCLTGDTRKQIFFFLYGLGNNGKSVFTSTLRKLLGHYAIRVSTDLFMLKDKSSGNGHKEGLANIKGKRLVIASELDDGRHLAVSLIKDLTGGENIRADRKYQHEIEFTPECKLWLVGNHKPVIKDTTLSIWRRVKLVPFTVTIPTEDIDEDLTRKLENEYPGILTWCVQGCLDWQQYGLNDPESVRVATSEYRADQDILREFLNENCFISKGAVIYQSELYKIYKKWCEDNDFPHLGKRWFGERLHEKGITADRGSGNKATWIGLRILSDDEKVNLVNYGNTFPETFLRDNSQEKVSGKDMSELTFSYETVNPKLTNLSYPDKPCENCGSEFFKLQDKGKSFICDNCGEEYGNS